MQESLYIINQGNDHEGYVCDSVDVWLPDVLDGSLQPGITSTVTESNQNCTNNIELYEQATPLAEKSQTTYNHKWSCPIILAFKTRFKIVRITKTKKKLEKYK